MRIFHTFLFVAVSQTSLGYAMGVNVKEIYKEKDCHNENLSHILICGSIPDQSGICNGCK